MRVLALLAVLLAPASAFAGPTILTSGVLRIDFAPTDFTILNTGRIGGTRGFAVRDSDPKVAMGLGATYGVSGRAELGVLFLPLTLSPGTDYGDVTAHTRYRLLAGRFELAIQFAVRIPTDTDFGLGLGAPMVFHLGNLDIETGAELELEFAEDTRAHLDVPVSFLFDVTSSLFFGVRTGVLFVEFEQFEIPLGPVIGARIPLTKNVRLDPVASFVFDRFIVTDGSGPIVTETWTLLVGANLRFGL